MTASVAEIKLMAAEAFGVSVDDIDGARRGNSVMTARAACYWLARRHTRLSFPQIGRAIGGRDHTTVMTGARRLDARMACDADLAARVNALSAVLAAKPAAPEIDATRLDYAMPMRDFVRVAELLGWRVRLERVE